MTKPKILAFAGSTRLQSFNKKLVEIAAEGARVAGGEVTVIDLRDFPMPLYDGDLEESAGIPEHARRFKSILAAHDGLLIASPEYNSSFSAVLKNAIDWATRPLPGEASLATFSGKIAALMSTSPGALGGLRGLAALRSVLENIQVMVLPDQIAIGKAHEAFTSEAQLKDAKQQAWVQKIASSLVQIISKLK